MLVVVQVPEHGLTVLAARGAERAVRRDGHSVQVAVVAEMVRFELAVGQVPHFHGTVPAARHDYRVSDVRREAHARNPVGVSVLLLNK